jgi:hypothetical protein
LDLSLVKPANGPNPGDFFRINNQYLVNRTGLAIFFIYLNGRRKIELNPPVQVMIFISLYRVTDFKRWFDGEKQRLIHASMIRILFLSLMMLPAFLPTVMAFPEKMQINIFQVDFIQVHEDLNNGLVFRGFQLNYDHTWIREYEKNLVQFDTKIGLGLMFSHAIPALGGNLVPLRVEYFRKLKNEKILLGFRVSPEYNYQLYPDLQAGFDYWFTTISAGPSVRYHFTILQCPFTTDLTTSLAGFVSRPPAYRDPYFYDLGFTYAIEHLHSGFQFGSFGLFNRTGFSLEYTPLNNKRVTIAYALEYFGFYKEPGITMLNHGFRLIFKPR